VPERERESERERKTETERETERDRETERQTERDRETDRDRETETDRARGAPVAECCLFEVSTETESARIVSECIERESERRA
jgi:RNA-binding protein 25